MSSASQTCHQSGVDVRPAFPSDACAIAAVHADSILATYPHLPITCRAVETGRSAREALWASRLREPGSGRSTVVAADGDQVCGFVYFGPSPDPDDDPETVGHVLSIHVSSNLTGRGVGTRLMKAAIAGFVAEARNAVTLWVVADNDGARRFYERLSWRRDGVIQREILAVGDGEGDLVEVVRYRRDLDSGNYI